MRKSLEEIFCSYYFGKLNYFIIDFLAKEVALNTFFCLELTFSRKFANSVFSFWLYSSKWKHVIHRNFCFFSHFQRFLWNWNIWYCSYMGYLKNRFHIQLFFLKRQYINSWAYILLILWLFWTGCVVHSIDFHRWLWTLL